MMIMKKQLLLFAMILLPLVASADAVEINGIYYNLVSKIKEAEVTQNPNKYTGNIVIPEKVTYENVEYSVTSIGNSAFYGCYGLTSVTIPNSVTSIGESAFSYCSGLKKVIVKDIAAWCGIKFGSSDSNPLYYAKHIYSDENTEITNLIIPNSVTSIGESAFQGCSSLTSVTIPNSVTSIGYWAFSECSGLTSVTIPNSVTSISDGVFYNCSGLTSVTIPNSVTSIGNLAFSGCSGLTSFTIPNSVTSISDGVFYGCSSLTSITIPNSVKSIGEYAFQNCKNLAVVSLPEDLYMIKRNTFGGCNKLKSIVIPSSVQYIYQEAFNGCFSLESVKVLATTPPFAYDNTFSNYSVPLLVPETSVDAYKTTNPWNKFTTIKTLDGSDVVTPQCATPTISYQNGQLVFNCETADVEFKSSITDTDIKDYTTSSIQLNATYSINVRATKSGYDNSETATATLCWIDASPKTEGITNGIANIPAHAVLIQSEGGSIKVQGVDEGTQVNVYSINGTQAGSAISQSGAAIINTNLQPGSIAIVKIGQKSVKVVIK